MKHQSSSGLSLRPKPSLETTGAACLLPAGLMAVGWGGMLSLPPWAIALGGAAAMGLSLLWQSRLRPCLLPVGLLLALLAGLLAPMQEGLLDSANRILEFLSIQKKTLYLPLETAPSDAFRLLLLWLGGLGISHAAATGRLWSALPVAMLGAAAVGSGFRPMDWAAGCLLAGLIVCVAAPNRGSALAAGIPALLVALILGWALWDALPADVPVRLSRWLHDVRCHHDTLAMPEGQLTDLPPRPVSGEAALEVTASQQEALYLRGFVGEAYTGSAWEPLDGQTLWENASLFYHLHENGFYAPAQIGQAYLEAGVAASDSITVKCLGACSAYAYAPYAVQGCDFSKSSLDDAAIYAENNTLSVKYVSGGVPEWYALQQEIGQEAIDTYLSCAQGYEDFVNSHYRAIPDEAAAALNHQLAATGEAMTLSEIKATIRQYLTDHLRYDEEVYTLCGEEDFLAYTLERSGSGYSVHYATAAALMLRYFGVPARYVEGYFRPEGQTTLTQLDAHAWAEYYLAGVGWIPFETTPGYPQDEDARLPVSSSDKTYQSDAHVLQIERPQMQLPPEESSGGAVVWPWLLPLLLIPLATVALRRLKLHRTLRRLRRAPHREAIPLWFAYAEALIARCPAARQEARWQEAYDLNCEALFSPHPMGEAQVAQMTAYVRQVLASCKAHWTVWQRFGNFWLKCLY